MLSPAATREFWYPVFHRLDLARQLLDGNPEALRAYLRHFWSHWSGPNYEVDEAHLDHLVDVYSPPGAFTASVGWYHSSSSPDAAYVAEIAPKPADRIRTPTTVLWQEFDPIFPSEWSDRLDEFFTDVSLEMLEGSVILPPWRPPAGSLRRSRNSSRDWHVRRPAGHDPSLDRPAVPPARLVRLSVAVTVSPAPAVNQHDKIGVPGRDRNRPHQSIAEENMSHPEEYDLVVLGSGRGRFLAWSLASQGKRAAVVERRYVTGSCPSIACLPSKNVIHGAKVASYFRRGAEFGIAAGDWKVEMPAVRDRKRKMVDGMVALNHQSVPRERRGACHGAGPLRRAEDDRGGDGRRRDAHRSAATSS